MVRFVEADRRASLSSSRSGIACVRHPLARRKCIVVDNFITQALELPNDTIAYTVSRRLAALFPNRAIIEGEDSTFDLLEFSEAGK